MKKSAQRGFIVLVFAFISLVSFSQTREEMRNTLASHLKEAKIHAKNIEDGFTKTKADQEKQIEEVIMHIEAAEKANEYWLNGQQGGSSTTRCKNQPQKCGVGGGRRCKIVNN